MEWVTQFDEMKSSALREIANVGISNAATAMGEFTKEEINISLPELKPFSKTQMMEEGSAVEKMAAVYFTVSGLSELTEAVLVMTETHARDLMSKFVESDSEILSLEEQKSILSEVSTVIAATYLSAVGGLFGLTIEHSIPQVSFGNGELRDFFNGKLQQHDGIIIDTFLSGKNSQILVRFSLIPDPRTLGGFFKSIGLE